MLRLIKSLKVLLLVASVGLFVTLGFVNTYKATDSTVSQSDYSGSIESGGFMRTYHLHTPPSYDGTKPTPLLFVFHGLGGNGEGMKRFTNIDDVADREGFIVVYPDGYVNSWADGSGVTPAGRVGVDDVGFVSALVSKLAGEFEVDLSRVYAVGFSNGGMFSHRLSCELSDKIAAVASVGGTMPEELSSGCNPKRPVSVMIMHGTQDPIVPWSGGEVRGVAISGWEILSVSGTAKKWAEVNGCSSKKESEPGGADEGTLFRYRVYSKCENNTEVIVYALKGGGHVWPKGVRLQGAVSGAANVDAGKVIWEFFEKHPKD